ncbi:MAG: hypothetical protein ACRC1K_19015, partial [Planctomycetia bacterium]
GFSRQDIVLNPGQADFGVVARGAGATKVIDVEYAGGLALEVREQTAPSKFRTKLEQKYRETGRVGYSLTVELPKDAPAGVVEETLLLSTNDPSSPALSLNATATIQPALVASPSNIDFGQIRVGSKVTRRIVVKGEKPFTMQSVVGDATNMIVQASEGDRTVHIVNVSFEPAEAGKVDRKLLLRTTMTDEEPVELTISGVVLP